MAQHPAPVTSPRRMRTRPTGPHIPAPRPHGRGLFPLDAAAQPAVRRAVHLHWAAGVLPAPAGGVGERVREGGLSKNVRLFLFGGGLGYLNSSVNSAF